MADSDREAAHRLELALARLREGTEILRTGGGTTLTADQCNALLDHISDLQRDNEHAYIAYRDLTEGRP